MLSNLGRRNRAREGGKKEVKLCTQGQSAPWLEMKGKLGKCIEIRERFWKAMPVIQVLVSIYRGVYGFPFALVFLFFE